MQIQSGLKYLRTAFVGLALTIPVKSSKTIAHDIPILKTPDINVKINERFIYENPMFDSYRLLLANMSNDINTAKFYKSLDMHKKSLKKDLHLSEAQYSLYKKVVEKIGKDERSIIEYRDVEMDDPFFASYAKSKNQDVLQMYRFLVKRPSKDEISLMKRYNINYPTYNMTPEQMAVSSVIHLAEMEKQYPKYLKIMKELGPDQKDPRVSASIKRAKKIMNNEDVAKLAINEIDALDLNMSFINGNTSNPLAGIISEQDIKDLKIYAKTIVMPKEDFLVEMWDRHPIIPFGKYENRACANILHLQLNK